MANGGRWYDAVMMVFVSNEHRLPPVAGAWMKTMEENGDTVINRPGEADIFGWRGGFPSFWHDSCSLLLVA